MVKKLSSIINDHEFPVIPWYLTNARILQGKIDSAALTTIHGAKERILNTPTDILLNLLRFNLNPEKSGDIN